MWLKLAPIAAVAVAWMGWYGSAEPLGEWCAPGRDVVFVPSGEVDPDQAKACTG